MTTPENQDDQTSNNSPEDKSSDVNTQNQGDESNQGTEDEKNQERADIDSLLASLEDNSGDDDLGDNDDQGKEDEEGKGTYKIGNHEFNSTDEIVNFAKKNYGEASRLYGENKKLKQKLGTTESDSQEGQGEENQGDQKQNSGQVDEDSLYWKFKAREFYDDNPDAKDYKKLMGSIIESGKASINDKPDFDLAYAKALRADGKKIPDSLASRIKAKTGKDDENTDAKKNLMKSGGGVGSGSSSGQSQEGESGSLGDFADKALLGF